MKKILLSLVAIAAAVFATSCTNNLLDEGVKGGNTVALTISTPELATRAYGNGEAATDLYYAIYESGTLLNDISVTPGETPEKLVGGQKTVYLTLAQGLEYEMIFWAGSPEAVGTLYEVNFAEKKMVLNTNALTSQNENLDAFYTRLTGRTIENLEGTTVELRRPFSQLNISVSNEDLEAARKANLVVGKTLVTVTTPTVLDIISGEATGETAVTYALANAANVAGYPKAGYHQLAMNYLLANASKSLVNVTFSYTRENSDDIINTREFGNVPVQRNYRTNIYGDILTKNIGFTVDLQEEWAIDANEEYDWNVVFTGVQLVKAILAGEKNILLGNDITVTAADIEAALNAPAPVMSRAAINALTAIINLGGYTITFENGAELDLNGGSVTIEGEGAIVAEQGAGFTDGDLYLNENSDVNIEEYKGEITTSPDGLYKAFEEGGEYTIGTSLKITEPLKLAAGKEFTLKFKNNAVLSIVDTATGSFALITNKGKLTIEGEGKLTIEATNNRGWNAYSSVLSNTVGGELTVKGVTIEHLGGTDMAYGIDNLTNGSGTKAVTIIDGATIKSPYRAVRQFLNGTEAANELYVKAGVIEGGNKSIWMQDPSKNANTGKLVVEADAQLKGDVYLFVTAGSTEWPVEVSIAKAALVENGVEVLTGNVPEGYQVVEKDGNYIVVNGNADGTYFVNTEADIRAKMKVANATIYIAEGDYKLEGKLSIAEGVSVIGLGEVSLFNDWGSNAFANQAHFTNTYVENVNFTNNLIIDAGIANGDVVFKKCTFGGDRAHQGVHFDSGNGTVTFDECTFVGRNMLGASLEKVTFNNCYFENKKSSLTGADKWTGVNMWGKYEFNNCVFGSEAHTSIKCDGVVATFNNCTIEGEGKNITDLFNFNTTYTYTITIDGTVINENSIFISNADELIATATTTIAAGQSVILTADIDLAGKAFDGLNAFNSENNNTFDGLGHTVSNWTNESGASDMGFIRDWVGPIKNLNIDNAHLKTNGRSAIVAAKVYGDIINCHVTNSTLEDSYWASGLIAGLYNAGSIKNCSATNSSIKSNGGTGGIVGVINETSGTRGCYNCSIDGVTVNNTGVYGEAYSAAGICGMLNVNNSTIEFKGCSVKNFTKEGKYVADIYYNANGNNVVVE